MKDLSKLLIMASIISIGALVGTIGEHYNSKTGKYLGAGIIFSGIGYIGIFPIEKRNYMRGDFEE